MKSYPSIINTNSRKAVLNKECIAFYKYDGSNLRFEWSNKRGWYKFGSRTRVFDKNDNQFGSSIDLFLNKYSEDIERKIKDNLKTKENVTVFMEYFGENSFAGFHYPEDEKELKLFDVNINKKGIISPQQFVDIFGKEDYSAEVIYKGKFNQEFIDSIRNDTDKYFEGIIAKGGERHNLWMIKVKTLKYLDLLQEKYQKTWDKYWE